jgi:hypothetical protein
VVSTSGFGIRARTLFVYFKQREKEKEENRVLKLYGDCSREGRNREDN